MASPKCRDCKTKLRPLRWTKSFDKNEIIQACWLCPPCEYQRSEKAAAQLFAEMGI